MILRNGISSTLRARGRTVLFTLLILILTLALTLGMGTWAYSAALLSKMDRAYTSVALVEYMGADYPDSDVADPYARAALASLDTQAISALAGVKLWQTTDCTLASVAGYQRIQGHIPYRDYSVLECSSFVPFYEPGWVNYTSEQLPEEYLIADQKTWTAFLQTAKGSTPPDLPYYYDKTDEGFLQILVDDAGTAVVQVTPETDMPREYIYAQRDDWVCHYRYIKDGQTLFALQERIGSGKSPLFYYESETDTYRGLGQVIRSYSGICLDPLYCREYSGEFLLTLIPEQQGIQIQPGTRYVLHGYFSPDGNNHNNFILAPFYEGCEILPWQQVTDGTYHEIFDRYAEIYATANNYVRLEASSSIPALEVFQQNILRLEAGRFPQAGETDTCVVSHDIAQQLALEPGSTIDLTVLSSDMENRFQLARDGQLKPMTVVGITTANEEYSGCVWVSQGGFSSALFGYQLGTAVLDNATARQTADAIAALCGDKVRVTLYDQGYAAAAQPLQTMQATAMAVTIAAACGTVAVLLLFAYLFVGRQRETVQVLVSLGTPKGKIRLWLLSGAGLICLVATVIGAAAGGKALGSIITLAMAAAQELYVADLRFSQAAVGFVLDAVTVDSMPLWPALASGCGVFLLALSLCLVFLRMTRRQAAPKRGKQTVRVPKSGTSTALRGALRFALLSARRGGWRSGIVPSAVLVLCLLMGILAAGAQGWSDQIDALYRDTKITGLSVSTNGRQDTDLLVSADSARTLYKSGFLEDISVSIGWNYWLPQEMPAFGDGEFAVERRRLWISQQPELTALNTLEAAPEFMHGQAPEVTYLDGWDGAFLADTTYHPFPSTRTYFEMGTLLQPENQPISYPCLVSQQFLDTQGLALGEPFSVAMKYKHYTWDEELYIQLFAVGSFQQTSSDANIYVPLSFWCNPAWITGQADILTPGERVTMVFHSYEDRDKYLYNTTNFSTCVFTLQQAGQLDALRDYLTEQAFSQVGKLSKNRTTILLRDQTFVETVGGLGRYISFSRILFPVLFAVVALLGFIISWLMVNGRRMEFAILRGLGAARTRVFLSFFLEQLLLCLLGCILGCGVLLAVTGPGIAQYLAVAVFLGCYLAGCALSVLAVGKTDLMQLLSERE